MEFLQGQGDTCSATFSLYLMLFLCHRLLSSLGVLTACPLVNEEQTRVLGSQERFWSDIPCRVWTLEGTVWLQANPTPPALLPPVGEWRILPPAF